MALKDKFGVNVCGEGGEYETFTLDSPLFKKVKKLNHFAKLTWRIIKGTTSKPDVGSMKVLVGYVNPIQQK